MPNMRRGMGGIAKGLSGALAGKTPSNPKKVPALAAKPGALGKIGKSLKPTRGRVY